MQRSAKGEMALFPRDTILSNFLNNEWFTACALRNKDVIHHHNIMRLLKSYIKMYEQPQGRTKQLINNANEFKYSY
jgi:hypothetical protein